MSVRFPKTVFKRTDEAGFTVLELLVGMLLTTLVLLGVVAGFSGIVRQTSDNAIMARADEQCRAVLDYMAFDIRMTGSGMPLSQSGFEIDTPGLGDAPLPLLPNADSATLTIRANETGTETVLTANYTPDPADLTLNVFSAAGFEVGDTIYLSDMTTGGANGLRGTVAAVGPASLQIQPDYIVTPAAVFKSGTLVNKVTNVTYQSPADHSGILRDPELGDQLLLADSWFSLTYLNGAGNPVASPLTSTIIKDDLTSIGITVNVQGEKPLSDGSIYTATASQQVALRNLILSR